MSITLSAIAYKTQKRGEMHPVDTANVTTETGVENDILGRPSKRQVTVMSLQQWQTVCKEVNHDDLSWLTRRANLLVDGIEFSADDIGKTIYIGNELALQITGETDPCAKMEKSVTGLEAALTPDWRGGVTTKVIHGGTISVNDVVKVL